MPHPVSECINLHLTTIKVITPNPLIAMPSNTMKEVKTTRKLHFITEFKKQDMTELEPGFRFFM